MKIIYTTLIIFLLSACTKNEEPVYLFSYFMGNGETGLYLASSKEGLTWEALNEDQSLLTPEIGKDKLMRDPCIIQDNKGRFHMVWTSGWWDKHIGYAWSDDLINWSEQKSIPVMEHEPSAKNCWAPELFFDEKNETFYIIWATTIPERHSDIHDSEQEKGLNHRMYATSTKDFETFEATYMFFNPDFSVIDATIMEDNGEFIMFLKNENPNPPEKNIRITKSDNAGGPYALDVSDAITGDYWAEGPSALKIAEYTYVYFDKYRKHKYGAVRSKDLVTWEDVSDSIVFPEGTRHGTAFSIKKEDYEKLLLYLNPKTD